MDLMDLGPIPLPMELETQSPRPRGEVVLTNHEVQNKRLPKGYAYEPVAPGLLTVPEIQEDEAGKRSRRQTPKALEAVGEKRPFCSTPKTSSRTSNSSEMESEERSRRKQEKRKLLEELKLIREAQNQANEKELGLDPDWTRTETNALAGPTHDRISRMSNSSYAIASSVCEERVLENYTTSTSQKVAGHPRTSSTVYPSESTNSDFGAERSKRIPKVNQIYGDSGQFITGNKIPTFEKEEKVVARNVKRSSTSSNPRETKRQKVAADRQARLGRLLQQCLGVLRNVQKNKSAWVFAEPVDVKGLNLVDYYDIVKKPMDFSTVKSKIDSHVYTSPLEFSEDMQLIFSNCALYNKPTSDAGQMGFVVSEDFHRRWDTSRIYEKWEDERLRRYSEDEEIHATPTVGVGSSEIQGRHGKHSSLEGYSSLSELQSQFTALQRQVAQHRTPGKVDYARDMTESEKLDLSSKLEQLPADKLGRVVEIVQESDAVGDIDKEEVELDLDMLDMETLWKLHRYVLSCVKPTKTGRPRGRPPKRQKVDDAPVVQAHSVTDYPAVNGGSQQSSSVSGSSSSSD
eukprot:CAMPEP_0196576420 /NCGR_PEP_ID=MMETSP1081-20130531/5678_1 /TAXON_ID=36882 /ORGANISM="Pyramimonas amylifera, Strain CCMP720" /LENGTH=571 /DNA_ID=CAMNT_0041895017 /DNA_START=725 /DNA_END=2440 /DNA_ORIENTATION=-